MRLLVVCVVFAALFLGGFNFVFAHGDRYLEFDPDTSDSLKVAEVETPSQTFTAQNDFLGGFDLWLSNDGSAGEAVFDILNEQGSVVSTKTLTIPVIPEVEGGTRFHVDLPNQFAVTSYKKYTIRISSPLPDLKLHYSDRVRLVGYNAPFVSEYLTGVGKLGSEEQTFSFKYALYERVEVIQPVISNVVWTDLPDNKMRVEFNANEPVDYKIEYGLKGAGYLYGTDFSGGYSFCTVGVSKCGLTIPVYPGTEYQYILTVKDSWGNSSQFSGIFVSGQLPTSLPSAGSPGVSPTISATSSVVPSPGQVPVESGSEDIAPPLISNLRIVEKTDKSIDIAWTTNEAANSRLLISFTTELFTIAEVSDAALELEHFLTTGPILDPNKAYLATITSRDVANNVATATIDFVTLKQAGSESSPSLQPPPTQSGNVSQPSSGQSGQITAVSSPSPGGDSVFVEWVDDGSVSGGGSYRVDIIDESGNLVKTVEVTGDLNKAELKNIPGGKYSVIVYKKNDNGAFEKIDRPVQLAVAPDSFFERLLGFWWVLLPLLGGLGYLIWRNRRRNKIVSKLPKP